MSGTVAKFMRCFFNSVVIGFFCISSIPQVGAIYVTSTTPERTVSPPITPAELPEPEDSPVEANVPEATPVPKSGWTLWYSFVSLNDSPPPWSHPVWLADDRADGVPEAVCLSERMKSWAMYVDNLKKGMTTYFSGSPGKNLMVYHKISNRLIFKLDLRCAPVGVDPDDGESQ